MTVQPLTTDLAASPNRNTLWTDLAVTEWGRLGLSLAVVCPGSRSAPLAHAIARCARVKSMIAHDERAAGFVALGAARATGHAALVVTTSGTAAANLLPAVVEASKTGTPMIIVSADRPAELQECGANQSIAQSQLFGSFARWTFDVPCADGAIELPWILSTIDEAWHRAHGPTRPAGPVHLNWRFREPLAPRSEPWDRSELASISRWIESGVPWRRPLEAPCSAEGLRDAIVQRIASEVGSASRTLVVVGALYSPAMRAAARVLVRALGCPVIADVGCGLRHGCSDLSIVAHGDLIALSQSACEHLYPECIVHIGGGVSSRRIGELCDAATQRGARAILIREGPERIDPLHRVSAELHLEATEIRALATLDSAHSIANKVGCSGYAAQWLRAQREVERLLAAQLDTRGDALDEPSAARIVTAHCASHDEAGAVTLLVGNSMPIRDADMHAARSDGRLTVAVNRGASGIDGLIATAVGHARATATPTWVHLGDLSLLHDVGSLALVRESPVPLVIVLVNNGGGGIFHFLPLAEFPTLLDPWSSAPHGTDFRAIALAFGLHYDAPETRGGLLEVLKTARVRADTNGVSTLIEVRTERNENHLFHRVLQQAIRERLDSLDLGCEHPREVTRGSQ